MKLTQQQERALITLAKKISKSENAILSGIAGSGKSTIIKTLIQDIMGLSIDDVVYGTFTGRASKVLRDKGLPSETLHRILYDVSKDADGKLRFTLKPASDLKHIQLLVIDELGPVPQSMIDDIRRLGIQLIGSGDPFQCDAIGKPNVLLRTPDFFLDEPHRQALEDPLYYWANKMRTEQKLPTVGVHGESLWVPSSIDEVSDEQKQTAEIILCGFNKTRVQLNSSLRKLEGRKDLLEVGDKVILTKNNWETVTADGFPVINGAIGVVSAVHGYRSKEVFFFNRRTFKKDSKMISGLSVSVTPIEGGADWVLFVDPQQIAKEKQDLNSELGGFHYLDYGHAMTIYKSQGSEFRKGLVFNQTFGDTTEDHMRQSYTALTRFKEKVIWIPR